MSERKMWDKYEAAVLLEAVLNIENNIESRNDAVERVSKQLRSMAQNRGLTIDDTYRNTNGISMQMVAMKATVFDIECKMKSHSKVFCEVVALYHTNQAEYNIILNQAHGWIDYNEEKQHMMHEDSPTICSTRDAFSSWLQTKQIKKTAPNLIIAAIDEVSEYATKHNVSKVSVWDISDEDKFNTFRTKMQAMRLFRLSHKNSAKIFDMSWKYYIDFLKDKKEDGINASQRNELKNYDYSSSTKLSFTKPELVMYFGAIDSNVASWRDVYRSVLNSLCEDYPYQIGELARDTECTWLSFNAKDLRSPVLVRNGIYAEGNKSATEIARTIRLLLDICKVDYENVVIRYWEGKDEHIAESVVATHSVEENTLPELSEVDKRLYEVIENRYVSGFLPGAINFKKIKRFYEEIYSQSLEIDGVAIEESLNKTCLQVNGKYYAPSALMEYGLKIRVNDYIETAMQSKGYVFYDNILAHFGYELTEKIPDVVLLKKYLGKEYPQYAALDGYLAMNATVVIDATKEVEQILFESVFPISVDRIKALLPHLTDEAIQRAIWSDDRIIVTNNNDRFLIDSMGITEEDLELIENLINEALNIHNCMFGNELLTRIQTKMPGLYESIRDFGDRGIRGAIAYKLKDKFKFNANIICKKETNIDNAEVFRSFAKSERYFTLSALINLKEQIGVGNVYFEAINEVSSRINDNDYVPNETLQFDSAAIDAVLNQIVIGNMCSLKEASNFAIYPSTCYPWTEYLLESYVAKYSDEFKLCHGGYAEGKCCGAVVKKSVSLNSIDDVVTEYLVLNREIQTAKEALERLVEDGFIARKRYKNIEDLLIIAKARRKD